MDSAYSNKKVKIQVHMATEATSTGDCLRYVEEMGVIEDGSTFMLVHGDVVSNVPLTPIIEAHKERYEKNASNIMTVTLKHLGPGHKMRSQQTASPPPPSPLPMQALLAPSLPPSLPPDCESSRGNVRACDPASGCRSLGRTIPSWHKPARLRVEARRRLAVPGGPP